LLKQTKFCEDVKVFLGVGWNVRDSFRLELIAHFFLYSLSIPT